MLFVSFAIDARAAAGAADGAGYPVPAEVAEPGHVPDHPEDRRRSPAKASSANTRSSSWSSQEGAAAQAAAAKAAEQKQRSGQGGAGQGRQAQKQREAAAAKPRPKRRRKPPSRRSWPKSPRRRREEERRRKLPQEAAKKAAEEAAKKKAAEEAAKKKGLPRTPRRKRPPRPHPPQGRGRQEGRRRWPSCSATPPSASRRWPTTVGDKVAGNLDDLIIKLVSQQWRRPPSARNGMSVEVTIQMLPDGTIANACGDPLQWRSAVRQLGCRLP